MPTGTDRANGHRPRSTQPCETYDRVGKLAGEECRRCFGRRFTFMAGDDNASAYAAPGPSRRSSQTTSLWFLYKLATEISEHRRGDLLITLDPPAERLSQLDLGGGREQSSIAIEGN